MGTTAGVAVVGAAPHHLELAAAIIRDCERRWTRFTETSELAQLNRSDGRPTMLPRDTYDLVAAAVRAWELTDGRFDPTVAQAVVAAGYDRTFTEASRVCRPSAPSPGCAGICLDDGLGAATLPSGVTLDLGGIAKGHTADLVVETLLDDGALGVLADLGGDVRVGGEPGDAGRWEVDVADPFDDGRDLTVLRLASGAVATSSTLGRRWTHEGRVLHHIIDPRTGRPADTGLATVTVVAGTAAWAEIIAKAALVAGWPGAAEVVHAAGATGLVTDHAGGWRPLDGLEAYR
jgi:thiamine biosynthesis lipoprotein